MGLRALKRLHPMNPGKIGISNRTDLRAKRFVNISMLNMCHLTDLLKA